MDSSRLYTMLTAMQSEISKLYSEIKISNKKMDYVGEIVNTANQAILDCSKKFDILFNGGEVTDDTNDINSKKTTKITSKSKQNPMNIFKTSYVENQSIWDEILESNDVSAEQFKKNIFDKNHGILDKLTGAAKLKEECNLLYKNLTNSQKNKFQKYIKQNPKNEEIFKDTVVNESSGKIEDSKLSDELEPIIKAIKPSKKIKNNKDTEKDQLEEKSSENSPEIKKEVKKRAPRKNATSEKINDKKAKQSPKKKTKPLAVTSKSGVTNDKHNESTKSIVKAQSATVIFEESDLDEDLDIDQDIDEKPDLIPDLLVDENSDSDIDDD
jgi:hypothetical protein